MELAVLLAAGLRDWIDFGVIIGILLLNAVVGWYQEKQAADVVASLKGDIALRSTVVRDGQEVEIKARELVPGDIVSSRSRSPPVRASVASTAASGIPGTSRTSKLTIPRSLLRMARSSLLMPALSAPMMTPMDTRPMSANSRHNSTTPPKRTLMRMRMRPRDTALDTPFWPLISLP